MVHITAKYLGDHSDVIGGVVVGPRDLLDPIAFYQDAASAVSGRFDAWLVLRGVGTLAVPMERHSANARALAEWLVGQPQFERVYYPGLPGHPNHDVSRRQILNLRRMLSVRL